MPFLYCIVLYIFFRREAILATSPAGTESFDSGHYNIETYYGECTYEITEMITHTLIGALSGTIHCTKIVLGSISDTILLGCFQVVLLHC